MEWALSGTALDMGTGLSQTFSASWMMTGGRSEAAGCDSWLVNQSASGFSMTLGGAPSGFAVNEAWAPYPCGGPIYVGLTGGPLNLWWEQGVSGVHGTVAGWTIESAQMVVTSDPPPVPTATPEPGVFLLAVAAALVYKALPWLRWRPRAG